MENRLSSSVICPRICVIGDWTSKGKSEKCISNSEQVKNYAKRSLQGHWTFFGPGDEKKWYGTLSYHAPENHYRQKKSFGELMSGYRYRFLGFEN